MCFYVYVYGKGKLTEQTAAADIPVYKFLTGRNTSTVRGFKYRPDTLYRLRKKLEVENGSIYEGFHSYRYEPIMNTFGQKIVKFIIPKGSKYFINNYECVSDRILSGDLVDMYGF